MSWIIYEDQNDPARWRVVGPDPDGECETIFCGPTAELRAREFAAWKNGEVFVIMRPER